MIKVFALNNLPYSPFAVEYGKQVLARNNIIISEESTADLIVSSSYKKLLLLALKYGRRKKYLVWTDEPHFDTHFIDRLAYPGLPKLHVFNVYTGIYNTNHRWIPDHVRLTPLTEFEFKHRQTVVVMGYDQRMKNKPLKYQGQTVNLNPLRLSLALEGNHLGVVDIYGRGWPEGIAKSQSREGNWRGSKQDILQNYHFNIALENTNWKYYCTEKIWDAIQGHCLPVYYGKGNAIYEDFPPDSFIDYCNFEDAADLFNYIKLMSTQEFLRRINLCIEVFNQMAERRGNLHLSDLQQAQSHLEKHGMQVGFMHDLAQVTAQRILSISR